MGLSIDNKLVQWQWFDDGDGEGYDDGDDSDDNDDRKLFDDHAA